MSLIVSIILFTSLFAGEVFLRPQIVHAAADANGTCGTSLTWVFTGATGNLTISGTGVMTAYGAGSAPWYSFRESITSLTINSGVGSIGRYAFYYCIELKGLTIPASVTDIGEGAFSSCSGLTGNLIIPASVLEIRTNAFRNCSGLTGLTISEGVMILGQTAFYNCSGLMGDLTIPASVAFIGAGAFAVIGSTNINVASNNDYCTSINGILYNKNLTTLLACPTGKIAAFTNLSIPSSVTYIGYCAFQGCSKLTGALTIPTGVQQIGYASFVNCSGLTGPLTIPTGVQYIYESAFQNCSNFTGELTIPASIISIGANAFWGCSGLTGTLTILEGLTSIEQGAFGNCNKLMSVVAPDSITTIGDTNVFYGTSPDMVINCHYGSTIDTYAKNNSLKYNNLYDAVISGVSNKAYTGSGVTQPSLVLTAKTLANPSGVAIIKDTDYTVSYSSNTELGTATVTVTGKGNYSGTLSTNFTIAASTFTVEDIAAQTYTGSEVKPAVVAKNGTITLIKDTDYTVTYSNNTAPGLATAAVTGINNYTGTVNKNFTINLMDSTLVISQGNVTYPAGPNPTVVTNASGGAVTYEYTGYGLDSWSASVPSAAGRYQVRGNTAQTGSYAAAQSAVVDFYINRADSTLVISQGSITEPSTPNPTVVTNTGGATVTYEYTGYGQNSWSAGVPSEPGRYQVRGNTAQTTNYNAAQSAAVDFYINALIKDIEVAGDNADNAEYVAWNGNILQILRDGAYTISLREGVTSTTRDSIKVASGVTADITLNGVKIDVSAVSFATAFDMTGATVDLNLVGENSLKSGESKAGLNVPVDAILTISGDGSLEAIGGGGSAGIGGGWGRKGGIINIIGGTITATGDGGGSGIGGGCNGDGGEITINGGVINAIGGTDATGIGGGEYGDGGIITINGGTIIANGAADAAGIGGGGSGSDSGEGGTITINGGTVVANGGTYGAAIGGGKNKLAIGTVTIDGGSVKVNNFLGPQPKNSSLENVYFNTITFGTPPAVKVPLKSFKLQPLFGVASIMAGAYGINDVFTDDSGSIYVWLPETEVDEQITATVGDGIYRGKYTREDGNTNVETFAKIAGADDILVNLTPDSTSKNAGYEGHIDVSFNGAAANSGYAMAIPMVFDKNTIEIINLETIDFDTKNLTGLLVNGTFLKSAADYDSSSEVLSVINADGKFILSWSVKSATPLVPHDLEYDEAYFRIYYRVRENVPTSATFAIGEYNEASGITSDQTFGVEGMGVLCSNQGDFGAYLLTDGDHGILTQKYINLFVEDMPAVTISGDVNSISLQGRAMLTGKQRTAISAIGYTPNLSKIDAGIRVEMYEVDDVGDIVKQVGSVAYTQEMNMTAAIGDPASTLYNYTLNIPRTVANDLKISDPTGSSPKYMLRFSRFGDNGGSVVGTVREESYLWADIYLDGTSVNTGTIDEAIPMTVGGTAYLYAGAFYLPTAEKFALTTSDLNTIKGQVGNADITGVTTIYNINEYLGVDAADYTTVLRYVGKTKLQPLPLVISN